MATSGDGQHPPPEGSEPAWADRLYGGFSARLIENSLGNILSAFVVVAAFLFFDEGTPGSLKFIAAAAVLLFGFWVGGWLMYSTRDFHHEKGTFRWLVLIVFCWGLGVLLGAMLFALATAEN